MLGKTHISGHAHAHTNTNEGPRGSARSRGLAIDSPCAYMYSTAFVRNIRPSVVKAARFI